MQSINDTDAKRRILKAGAVEVSRLICRHVGRSLDTYVTDTRVIITDTDVADQIVGKINMISEGGAND